VTENIFLSCEYSGVDKPLKNVWLLDDKEITGDTEHLITRKDELQQDAGVSYYHTDSFYEIKKPTWEDGGIYTCRFTFQDGNNVQKTLPKTIIVEGSGLPICKTYLEAKMQLNCNFQTKETVEEIAWTRWKDKIDAKKIETGEFKENKITSVLKITDGDASDGGRYYCKAKLSGHSDEFVINSDARFAKVSIKVDPPAPHYFGGRVTIQCEWEGKFSSKMLHFKKTGSAFEVSLNERSSTEIRVESARAGEYICRGKANNECKAGEVDVTATTTIKPLNPSVIEQPKAVSVTIGQKVQLSCIVPMITGASTKIAWYKEGSNDPVWPKNTKEEDQNRWVSVLTFNEMTFNEVGKYKCKATYGGIEDLESDFATLSLVAFKTDPSNTQGILGGQAKFTCAFASDKQVSLLLETNGGDTSNSKIDVQTTEEGVSKVSTGIATFTSLTESNGNGKYYCKVDGESYKSEEAELTVISIAEQPIDSWTVTGETAGFTVRIERFEWENYKVTWQKKVSGNWENVVKSATYRVNDAKGKLWYTFINIPNYDSATESTEWRVSINFPEDTTKGLIGGDLISNSAFVKKAGVKTVEITKADTNEGTTFTLKCTVTAREKPSYMKIKMAELRRMEWEQDMTFTFDKNIATVIVKKEAEYWFSGEKIGCETTVSGKVIEMETDFYTVTKTCPTLERDNGVITINSKYDGKGTEIGKTASLKCDTGNGYQPYRPPNGAAVTTAVCLFATGAFDQELTSCSKVIAIDFSLLKPALFFEGTTGKCNTDAGKQNFINKMNGAKGKRCGFRNVGFPCFVADKCDFLPEKSVCFETYQGGKLGSKVIGHFKLKPEVVVDKAARDDPTSEYNNYKKDADKFNDLYTKYGKTNFWRCLAKRRRRAAFERAAFERAAFGDPTDETIPTTTTPSETTVSTTTPTTPTTKMTTPVQANQDTEERATRKNLEPGVNVKAGVPDASVTDSTEINREETFEAGEGLEEFDFMGAEEESDVSLESDSDVPASYNVIDPNRPLTEHDSIETTEDPTKVKEIVKTLGLPKLEFNIGTLILLIGLLAGVSIVIIFKIVVTARKKLLGTTKDDYTYTQLCES